jgi:hypothetical protein
MSWKLHFATWHMRLHALFNSASCAVEHICQHAMAYKTHWMRYLAASNTNIDYASTMHTCCGLAQAAGHYWISQCQVASMAL